MKKWYQNQSTVNNLADYIRIGCSIKGACGGVGISYVSYYNVMKQAENDIENNIIDSDAVNFFNIIKKAEQEFETTNLNIIKSHAVDDWKAAAWLLERRRQKEYVVRQDIQFSTPEKITINMDVKPDGDN